jgi:hypothetical protein
VRAFDVHFVVTPEHLMVADAAGRFRIIEFIDGELRATPAEQPWQVSTNNLIWNHSEIELAKSCGRHRAGSDEARTLRGVVDYEAARHVTRSMSHAGFTM